ncbi:3-deoxy-manno-octulosonate cytidylyltransferase [Runella slithyformis]|uniref:3-deoxy-manno-octulosonate cytidylyltransferase n=1 Tax=Runella slithyformis (strain ATCC 29530 / DSM 19594 / LMG 11500 / NCIMB 11436 / LSU 4) TaxID=761193 RepID=A0A7U3ZMS1_RUNSL|nr:3-deoxy-manno-octulosonate cytidylyltransferase [Runella slithyformis]AEI50042.1 3-deoxy-manno-octulosonate cytidylyltransferase [Runella slithyformis DSM 19594]
MIIGIIPARYASTRFPGKPLIDIQGKSMIRRVYEQASQAKCLSEVIVATDDERILNHVQSFGGKAVMTHPDHPSGTDRCWEAYCLGVRSQEPEAKGTSSYSSLLTSHSYVINIQGDEPFVAPEQIDELGAVLDGSVELASQMIPVSDHDVLFDVGEAKVIVNQSFEAIYFSRQVLPFLKGIDPKEWHNHHTYYRQVGMYAYRSDILEKITQLPVSDLEKAESLEQLRWIQNGYRIKMGLTAYESHCIDTPEDVEKVLRLMNA